MVRLLSLSAFAMAATAALAADVGQYVDQYAGSSHSSSEVGGYQQLVDQYAANYTRGTGAATILAASEDAKAAGKASSASPAKTDGSAAPGGFDYSKFMKGGGRSSGQSSGAGSPGGDYQQYMDKYMKGGSSGKNGSAGGQGGGYQQYMKQYGDYSKYMGGGKSGGSPGGGSPGGGSPGGGSLGGGSPGGGNPGGNYMNQYAGGFIGGGAGPKAGASATSLVSTNDASPQAAAGGSQQFMTKYASAYMGGAGPGASYQQFMDKYAGDYAGQFTGSSPAATSLVATGSSDAGLKVKTQGDNSNVASGADAGYQQYMKQYTGSYTGGGKAGKGGQGGWNHFMSDYAGQYMGGGANASSFAATPSGSSGGAGGYQQYVSAYTGGGGGQTMAPNQQAANALPYNAADCKTLAQLKAWKDSKTKQMKSFVPAAYQAQPLLDVEKDYRAAKAKLEAKATETRKDLQEEKPAKESLDSTGTKIRAVQEEKPAKVSLDSTGAIQDVQDDKSVEQKPATDVEDADPKVADAEDADAEGAATAKGSNEGATVQLAEISQGAEGRHVNLTVVVLAAVAIGWIGLVAFRRQRALASIADPLLQSEVDANQYVPLCAQA